MAGENPRNIHIEQQFRGVFIQVNPRGFFFFNLSCAGTDEPGEEKARGEILAVYMYPYIYMYLEERCNEGGARVSSVVPSDSIRGKGLKPKHRRFPLNVRKHVFYCEGDQTLARVAQGGCGLAVLGDIQELPGHGPG